METFSKRIKFIRNYLNKTREEFGKFVDFPEMTIRSWEYKNVVPSNKSLEKLFNNLLTQNVSVSYDWLTMGSGLSPFELAEKTYSQFSEKDIFLQHNPNAITFTILHNRFLPFFKKNELIGGIPLKTYNHLDFVFLPKGDKTGDYDIKQIYMSLDDKNIILMSLNEPQSKLHVYQENHPPLYKIIFRLDVSLKETA